MTVRVPRSVVIPLATDVKVGKAASAGRIAAPSAEAINFLRGHLVGGVKIWQACGAPPDGTSTKLMYKIRRHPRSNYLGCFVTLQGAADATNSLAVKAGTGNTQALTINLPTTTYGWANRLIAAPWDTADTVENVIVSTVDVGIQNVVAFDWPRETLEATGDKAIHWTDPTYPRCGLRPGDAITASRVAGTRGLIYGPRIAFTGYQEQIVACSWKTEKETASATPETVGVFRGMGRRFTDAGSAPDTIRCTAWYYARMESGGTHCDIQFDSAVAGDSLTEEFSNTTVAWGSLADFEVATDQTETITVTMNSGDGSHKAYLKSVCIIAENRPPYPIM